MKKYKEVILLGQSSTVPMVRAYSWLANVKLLDGRTTFILGRKYDINRMIDIALSLEGVTIENGVIVCSKDNFFIFATPSDYPEINRLFP